MGRAGWVIVAAALILRLWGVQYGLPHLYHQDEPILVNHALAAAMNGGDPGFYVIPGFTIYLLMGLYGLLYLGGRAAGVWPDTEGYAAAFLADPTLLYTVGRVALGALAGALTVLAVRRIAARWLSARAALWAAVLMALAPMHVQHSRYIYADVPLALATTVLLGALLGILERPVARRYAYAGAALGWAAAVKYTALYLLPAALAAHTLAQPRAWASKKGWAALAAAAASCAVLFICFNPYFALNTGAFIDQLLHQKGAEVPTGPLHHLVYSIAGGTGWASVALAVVGWCGLWRDAKRRNIAMVAGIWIAGYYAVNVFFSQHFARYMMPLIPVVCLLAGAGVDALASGARKTLAMLAVVAVLVESGTPALYGAYLSGVPDTRTQCLGWFENNVPSGAVVALDNKALGPRLKPTREQLAALQERLDAAGEGGGVRARRLRLWERALGRDARRYTALVLVPADQVGRPKRFLSEEAVLAAEPDAILRTNVAYIVVNDLDRDPAVDRLLGDLSGRIERVAVFSPYRDERRVSPIDRISTTAAPHLAADLLSRERLGPYLEVYRVRS